MLPRTLCWMDWPACARIKACPPRRCSLDPSGDGDGGSARPAAGFPGPAWPQTLTGLRCTLLAVFQSIAAGPGNCSDGSAWPAETCKASS